MNIQEKMTALVERMQTDFNGYDVPLAPECHEDWGPDYAVVCGYYFDPLLSDNEYTDYNRLRIDFEKFVVEHFEGAVGVSDCKSKKYIELQTGEVVVVFHRQSQEIEVYRK